MKWIPRLSNNHAQIQKQLFTLFFSTLKRICCITAREKVKKYNDHFLSTMTVDKLVQNLELANFNHAPLIVSVSLENLFRESTRMQIAIAREQTRISRRKRT